MTRKAKVSDHRPSKKGRPKIIALIACMAGLLLLAACGELTPTSNTEQLLINEVYTGTSPSDPQYIELLNNTNDPLNLSGYKLDSPHGTIDLSALTVGTASKGVMAKGSTLLIASSPQAVNDIAYNFLVNSQRDDAAKAGVKRPPLPVKDDKVLGKLDPTKDLIVLRGPDNSIIDQLGWGGADRTGIQGISSDLNLNLPAANNTNKSLGRTPTVGQRAATDPGEINPGQFTIHNSLTPGIINIPRSPTSFGFIFTTFTDAVTTVGAALLWLAFVIIALVAQRFETLSEQKTYWRWLMAAPVGILIYAVIQVLEFVLEGRLTDFWSWPAFLALFLSGLACLYVINIFRLIAKNILESE
jgi:hypothetical protein